MKTHQPLFSVLIANYNNGKYLMDAIESVRQQSNNNMETMERQITDIITPNPA